MNWLIPCNPNIYDVFGAFNKYKFIHWRQKVKYNIGDIVYIYCIKPYQKIMFKCIVEDLNVSSDNIIDDSEFWVNKEEYKESLNMEFFKIKCLKYMDSEDLDLQKLIWHGLKTAPQEPMRLNGDILGHIENAFHLDYLTSNKSDQITTIQEIKDEIDIFVKERNWNKFHNPKNLSMSIAIEASELMEIFQWLSFDEAWNINNSDENIHVQEELSDVIIYCLSLANQLDIDIATAIEDKLGKNAIKYPAR